MATAQDVVGGLEPGGAVPARFIVGDTVEVLRATRLPKVEEVVGAGTVERVTGEWPTVLYWVSGCLAARTSRELRLLRRAR